jgi:hypothetical protein
MGDDFDGNDVIVLTRQQQDSALFLASAASGVGIALQPLENRA